jgi:phage terminase Nu1 subunit (DNA packaging protein)
MAEHNKNITQEQFARIARMTQPAVAQLIQKGVLTRGGTLTQWIGEYIEHQRKIAAQHASASGWDLIEERARLAARQSEKLEIEIAAKREELVPIEAVVSALQQRNGALRSKLLALPSRYKSMNQSLTPRQVDSLDNLVREILEELAHEQFPRDIADAAERYFQSIRPAPKTEGKRVGRSLSDTESRV